MSRGDFPAEVFRLDGDPGAIRSSAAGYQQLGSEASDAAGQIRGLDTSLFVGPEGDQYRDGLKDSLPPHLDTTGQAYGKVAGALTTFADALSGMQDRMRPLAAKAPGLWEAMQAANGRVDSAKTADHAHQQHVDAAKAALKPHQTLPPDTYVSDGGAAAGALSTAQQAWNECLGAAQGIKGELKTAVDTCHDTIRHASGMRFKRNPHGLGRVSSAIKTFVKDHAGALAKLSGVLKGISFITGVLSFIPVVGEVTLAISMITGGAALAIDGATMWANGKWNIETLGLDSLALLPAGGQLTSKLAGKLGGLLRGARAGRAAEETGGLGNITHVIPTPAEGTQVWRVYGEAQDSVGGIQRGSRPFGDSWTPRDPRLSPDFRYDAGLPNENPGRFLIAGRLRDPSAVREARPALELDGTQGAGRSI